MGPGRLTASVQRREGRHELLSGVGAQEVVCCARAIEAERASDRSAAAMVLMDDDGVLQLPPSRVCAPEHLHSCGVKHSLRAVRHVILDADGPLAERRRAGKIRK